MTYEKTLHSPQKHLCDKSNSNGACVVWATRCLTRRDATGCSQLISESFQETAGGTLESPLNGMAPRLEVRRGANRRRNQGYPVASQLEIQGQATCSAEPSPNSTGGIRPIIRLRFKDR